MAEESIEQILRSGFALAQDDNVSQKKLSFSILLLVLLMINFKIRYYE